MKKMITDEMLINYRPFPIGTENRLRRAVGSGIDIETYDFLKGLDVEQMPERADWLWLFLMCDMIPVPRQGDLWCRFLEDVLPIWEIRYPEDLRPRTILQIRKDDLDIGDIHKNDGLIKVITRSLYCHRMEDESAKRFIDSVTWAFSSRNAWEAATRAAEVHENTIPWHETLSKYLTWTIEEVRKNENRSSASSGKERTDEIGTPNRNWGETNGHL